MDVTCENFEEVSTEMIDEIDSCDFCSIDCEFTGITEYTELNSFDTPQIRYDKMRKSDEHYAILQIGLCFFKKLDTGEYHVSPYNVYLHKKSNENSKFGKNSKVLLLSSSIEFLIQQNYDFNKTFSKGLTYMSKDYEETIRSKVLKSDDAKKELIYPQKKDKESKSRQEIEKLMIEIDEFFENSSEEKKEIKCSEFIVRMFVEKNIKRKYGNMLKWEYKNVDNNKERVMVVNKNHAINGNATDLEILDKEIGFSKIMWHLSDSKKLIIGHNMLTDLMQVLKHFYAPLPESFDEFKQMANSYFPKIIDTKYIALTQPFKDLINMSSLENMNAILSKSPFKNVNIGNCKYSLKEENFHEAGYDAFITGYCYIRMVNYMEFLTSKANIYEQYLNKIHFMKIYDSFYIDLVNDQPEASRDHVFYVEHPNYWDNQDLFNLFNPYGNIFVARINAESSFVAVNTPERVKKVISDLVGVSGREYRVYFYSTFISRNKNKHDSVSSMSQLNSSQQTNGSSAQLNDSYCKYDGSTQNSQSQNSNLKRKNDDIIVDDKMIDLNGKASSDTDDSQIKKKKQADDDKVFDVSEDW